ncbi:GH3 family domain-containing protein [Marinigracilibium pacificum]|uniref:GH3 auxin-responsive promoter family protein n=1 Tax=Marinigracilibium pacificum TaxID=2729599 RepID=A0A848J6F6_9BACT|nr:GH3 auxin-responsive promoter family protein [Marinigracilibium pacificum]NMM50100.1 GH3 auxin-responsive promoter family protein [Marinigracilibium pacificum]
MAILGNIIKSALEFSEKALPEASPVEEQKEVLLKLLKKASATAFGKYYGFSNILKSNNPEGDYSKSVPFHDYDAIYDRWWKQQIKGIGDITWPGKPDYYALSSGTTGSKPKKIPVTNDMLNSIRKVGVMQLLSVSNFDLPANFFEKEIMMLGSSTDLNFSGDHYEGEISGISASNIPSWFRGVYRPGVEIASTDDWNERISKIVEDAPSWDIGAISGIPSWNELMIKSIVKHYKLENIHEIWPDLSVFVSGGVAFGPYKKSFDKLLGKPITVIDTYLASEGFLAYQSRPNKDRAMRLAVNAGIYFEFIPFDDKYFDDTGMALPESPVVNLSGVKEGVDYALVISTVSGAWRYLIGDTIKFTDVEKAEIVITGRTKHFLNVVGSQLSVMKMNDAIKHIEEKFKMAIPEYTVSAVRESDGEYYHHWILGSENAKDPTEVGVELDKYLSEVNKNYNVARGKALRGIKLKIVSPSVFYDWNETVKKKGGQVKMPRVMKEEDFIEYQEFIQQKV